MEINLKTLEEALGKNNIPSLDIDTESSTIVELIKDFSVKVLEFLTKVRSSAEKIKEQISTFNNVDMNADPSILNSEVYGYSKDRFDFLITRYVAITKDVRSVVRYLASDRLDNAAKMADRVAKYLEMKNDVFKLKQNPESVGRTKASLKEHGFSITNMVEHQARIVDILDSEDLNNLRKSVEREMAKAKDKDVWPSVAYKFSSKAINELAEIAIKLGNQQLQMLKLISK